MNKLQDRKRRLELRIAINKRMSDLLKEELTELNKDLMFCNDEMLKERERASRTEFAGYRAKDISVQAFMWYGSKYGYGYRTNEDVVFECNSAAFERIFKGTMCSACVFCPRCLRIRAVEYSEGNKEVLINSIPLRTGDYICRGENGYVFACPKQVFEVLYVAES